MGWLLHREIIDLIRDAWLPVNSQKDTLEYLLETNLINTKELKRRLYKIARDYRTAAATITDDAEEKRWYLDRARRAERVARELGSARPRGE